MRVSHKHKFVFIAIPKTGSSSIRTIMREKADVLSVPGAPPSSPLYHHVKPSKLETYFKEQNWNWNEYFKFTFVRNPWDRAVSVWEYRNRVASEQNFDLYAQDSFAIQSKKLIHKWKTFKGMLRQTDGNGFQYNWCFDENGNKVIDVIGRFENFQEDFNIVCDRIGIPQQQLPHKNKTKHKHYTEYYDEETKQIVAEKYAKDIEYFGYKFHE